MHTQTEMSKKITDAFYHVLKTTSFAKAKVTNITKCAGISNQTFYRYYLDKYDLAQKITNENFFAFYDIYRDNATWKEIVVSILTSIKNYPIFFKRLLADPDGAEIVLQGIISVTKNFTGKNLSRHTVAIWISILREWSKNSFDHSVNEIYEQIRQFTPLKEVFSPEEIARLMDTYENQTLDYFKRT